LIEDSNEIEGKQIMSMNPDERGEGIKRLILNLDAETPPRQD